MLYPMPFQLQCDPIIRLLLVNFEKDPDSVYVGFEPQVLLDADRQERYVVIGWRSDGRVDVYHDPALSLDPTTYTITGKGLHAMSPRVWENDFFRVTPNGVEASFTFEDLDGRSIELHISEKSPRSRHPFGLLAPMGLSATNPTAMPLIFLQEFYFVRRRQTELRIAINGRVHKPDPFPIPLHGSRVFFSRYSNRSLAVMFNPSHDGSIPNVSVPDTGEFQDNAIRYNFDVRDRTPHLQRLTAQGSDLSLHFDPPLPPMDCRQKTTGLFAIHGPAGTGAVKGHYSLDSDGVASRLTLQGDGWTPEPSDLTTKLIFAVAKPFRHWPKSYRWTADLQKKDGIWQMQSAWERI